MPVEETGRAGYAAIGRTRVKPTKTEKTGGPEAEKFTPENSQDSTEFKLPPQKPRAQSFTIHDFENKAEDPNTHYQHSTKGDVAKSLAKDAIVAGATGALCVFFPPAALGFLLAGVGGMAARHIGAAKSFRNEAWQEYDPNKLKAFVKEKCSGNPELKNLQLEFNLATSHNNVDKQLETLKILDEQGMHIDLNECFRDGISPEHNMLGDTTKIDPANLHAIGAQQNQEPTDLEIKKTVAVRPASTISPFGTEESVKALIETGTKLLPTKDSQSQKTSAEELKKHNEELFLQIKNRKESSPTTPIPNEKELLENMQATLKQEYSTLNTQETNPKETEEKNLLAKQIIATESKQIQVTEWLQALTVLNSETNTLERQRQENNNDPFHIE